MTDRELMQMALDALESSRVFVTSREKIKHPEGTEWYDERIEALRAALAQPEPVLVSPKEFISAVTGKWDIQGIPMLMSVWPVPEKAQPEQEPVAWVFTNKFDGGKYIFKEPFENGAYNKDEFDIKPLYTAPPQREWQSLTDEEIDETAWPYFIGNIMPSVKIIVRQLEAKLKEKNGG